MAWRGAVLGLLALAAASTNAADDPTQGQIKAHMCIGCHTIANFRATFPAIYRVPLIRAQSKAYIVAALKEYQAGNRYRPNIDKLASMPAIAASLSDDDIDDLATYFSSLSQSPQ